MLAVVAVWLAWLAGWLCRVELQRKAGESAKALGFRWAREGVGPSVVAVGTLEGVKLAVRWRRSLWGVSVKVRLGSGGPWQVLPEGQSLEEWTRTLARLSKVQDVTVKVPTGE